MLRPALLAIVVVVAKLGLDWFFSSQLGLAMRATGANPRMARAQGIATGRATLAGMALSNALVALAGALFAQTQGGADISMGIGTIVIGLAAVIIGETLLPARRLVLTTLAVVLGAIVYRFFIALALNSVHRAAGAGSEPRDGGARHDRAGAAGDAQEAVRAQERRCLTCSPHKT